MHGALDPNSFGETTLIKMLPCKILPSEGNPSDLVITPNCHAKGSGELIAWNLAPMVPSSRAKHPQNSTETYLASIHLNDMNCLY